MEVTVRDIKDHFLNNLGGYKGDPQFGELYKKVQEVKDDPEFIEFMVNKYNQGQIQIGVLELYFLKK